MTDRRGFLCAAGAAVAAAVTADWAGRRLGRAPEPERIVLPEAAWPAVGEATALLTPSGIDVLAVRLDLATVVAYDRRCPHLGCPVVWTAARACFECPCHRASFEARTGRVLGGPPRRGLAPMEVVAA